VTNRTRPVVLDDVVLIHQEAFPGFFMTQLGPRFLREYYRCVLEFRRGLLLTEYSDSRCCGFVAGFIDPASFYEELHSRRLRLGLAAAAGIVARPGRLLPLIGNYARAERAAHQPPEIGTAELSSLAVRPSATGRGLGSRLVREFIAAARDGGAARVVLTTDAIGNEPVNEFYRRLGFTCRRTFQARRNRLLNEYVIETAEDRTCVSRS
jgi:ribosomal protein S18 acetylase RimI-like enzyme